MESNELTQTHGIGAVVFWALHDVKVARADMRAVFEAQGLGAAVQRDPSPGACLSRATTRAAVGRPTVRFERVRDDATIVTEALLRVEVDAGNESADFQLIGRISVDKATGACACSVAPGEALAHEALAAARDAYDDARSWCTTADLGAALKTAMYGRARDLLLGGVNMRGQSGGVYYVQQSKLYVVEALAAWVESNGFGTLTILRLTGDGAAQVGRAARATITDRLTEVSGSLDELIEKVRLANENELDRILEPTLARFELISQQADLYADVLGSAREELLAKAERTKRAILARCVA